jgi:hypothetical protein
MAHTAQLQLPQTAGGEIDTAAIILGLRCFITLFFSWFLFGFIIGGFGILFLIANNPLDTWGGFFGRSVASPWGMGLFAVMVATGAIYAVALLLAFMSATIKGDLTYAKRVFTREDDGPYLPAAFWVIQDFTTLMLYGIFISSMVRAIASAM